MMYGPYSDYYGWGAGSPIGGFGGIIMMVLMLLLIVWIVREVGGRNARPNSSALDVLKERYAKGEIDKKEFEEKKKDLGA